MLIRRIRSLVVKAVIEVTTVVVEGYADEADLVAWVTEAISRYHNFRAGYINHEDKLGGIVQPIVRNRSDLKT